MELLRTVYIVFLLGIRIGEYVFERGTLEKYSTHHEQSVIHYGQNVFLPELCDQLSICVKEAETDIL